MELDGPESEDEQDTDWDSSDGDVERKGNMDDNEGDALGTKQDKKRKNRREKGPPIVCLMCKTVWTKNRKGGRLFMFGGTRPFMAKFEAKFKALMGREDLTELQNKSATKFGRSYICRECFLLVRQTYDNIRKLQRNVSKSLFNAKSFGIRASCGVKEEPESDSDADLEFDAQAHVAPKKKLPPVAERIADKIANLKLVKINSKVPQIILKRVSFKDSSVENNETDEDETDEGEDSHRDGFTEGNVGQMVVNNNAEQRTCPVSSNQHMNKGERHFSEIGTESKTLNFQGIHDDQNSISQLASLTYEDAVSLRPHTDNVFSSREAEEFSAISLNTDTSFASQHTLDKNAVSSLPPVTSSADQSNSHTTLMLPATEDSNSNSNTVCSVSSSKPPPEKLAEILANPLLLIKAPQPIKLADVKNENVYICGEGDCDWIFSSRFFWENHIRHYHRSGKPFICSFEGCGRSFTGKSKLELHERSHTDERPFICDKCGSGFRGNQELRAHKLTHTSDKPHQCPKCDKNFKLLSSLKRHLQFHDGGNFPYPCTYPGCEKAFKSRYDLKCHYRLHTGEKPYKCPEPGCGMAFRIPCQFTMHKRSHTGERPFRCSQPGCSAAYISSNALQAHMLSHSSDRPFCCEFCGKTFKHKMLYRMHLKKHSGPQSFHCPVEGCGEEYADRSSLDQHMASHHGIQDYRPQNKKMYECQEDGCGLKYSTDGGLRYHKLKVHKKECIRVEDEEPDSRRLVCPFSQCEKEYEEANDLEDHLTKAHMTIPREKMCPLCGSAFPHTEQLELHHRSVHNENNMLNDQLKGTFVCNSERCGLRFHRLEELKHHVTWHLGNPPYRCELEDCGRTFLLESMHTNHILEHENLKPYTCSFDHCQEGYTSRIKLLKHSKVHYGLFRCPMDGCTKSLQTLTSARLHLQRHEKPFVCMLCGKRFSSSSVWAKHNRSHTGEKVYECRVCTTMFPDPDSLKQHKRLHKGEKRYMCEECGQRFSSRVARKNHMISHSNLPYLCPEEDCGKAFRELGSLKAHQTTHSKPSHLCTQCGKVYKLRVSKHRCKIEPENPKPAATSDGYLQPPQPQQQQPQLQQHQLLQQQQHQQTVHQLAPQGPQLLMSQPTQQPPPPPPPPLQTLPQTIPPSIPQSLPQIIPQALAQIIPQSLPQSIPQSLSQPVPQSLGQTIPQIPHSLTQSVPLSIAQSRTQTVAQTLPQPIAQTLSQPTHHPLPQSLSQSLAQSLPQSLPQSLSQPIAHQLPQPLPQTMSQPISQQGAPQQYMSNMMMPELPPQSYVMEVEEAARAMRQNFGAPDTIVVDPAYYNYIILCDRPVQQQ